MSPEEVDALAAAVAERVVERLRDEAVPPSEPTALLDARALAARLGVSPSYVYANSGKLGAVRLGTGPKARLRFNLKRAVEVHANREPESAAPAALQTAKPRPRRAASSVALLPVKNGHERRTPGVDR